MILQELYSYYKRKKAFDNTRTADVGFEWKEIPFIIVLSKDGIPLNIEDTTEDKTKRGKKFLVPKGFKKTSGIKANLFWDNPEYTLGLAKEEGDSRVKEQHQAFKDTILQFEGSRDIAVSALITFLNLENKFDKLSALSSWTDLCESKGSVSFRLVGDKDLICNREAVYAAIAKKSELSVGGERQGICLITGKLAPIERLHASIKGVRGTASSGASIVSFNQNSFCSYQKEQGANAPVCKEAAFAYTTALNMLLDRDSNQRLTVGDTTIVFWAQKDNSIESSFLDIFNEPTKDDPDRGTRAVNSLYNSIRDGAPQGDIGDNNFFILGLAPNISRLSIRFFIANTVDNISRRIAEHFDDLKIIKNTAHLAESSQYPSLFRLLLSTAHLGKADNIDPKLAGDMIRAILCGTKYPQSLLHSLVRRIRAESGKITFLRASLLKAFLNRERRFSFFLMQEELKMSLDVTNTNIGYLLGRLFAVLEKIQKEASPGLNSTVRDRFYGAASGTPVAVFSVLLRLKNHHLKKIEQQGRVVVFEKLLSEILDKVSIFPGHLNLVEQGQFAIGYYHQAQDFYVKKHAPSDLSTPV